MENENSARANFQLIVGILFVIAGGLLLLANFDIVDVGPIWRLWPLIIVGIGVNKTVSALAPRDRRSGVWLTFVGIWLLVSVLHVLGLSFATSWPILIIGWGIGMVWKAASHQASINVI